MLAELANQQIGSGAVIWDCFWGEKKFFPEKNGLFPAKKGVFR
jgi:hypothetical protein